MFAKFKIYDTIKQIQLIKLGGKMITVENLSLSFNGTNLFKDVNLKFTPGNCYGIIGANGAGKSTFLKILCGELEPTTGSVSIPKNVRLSVLKQNHYAYDDYTVLDTVIMGNARLYEIMKTKDELYSKPDFSEEDGLLVSELENEFAELNGWEAESDASKLIQGLGLSEDILNSPMSALDGNEKVKVLLAQALFGNPDILILDEPTAGLDVDARNRLLDMLRDYMEKRPDSSILITSHISTDLEGLCDDIYMIHDGNVVLHEDTDVLLDKYAVLKVDEAAYEKLDRTYILKTNKESFGYSCFTNEKQFYVENYPGMVVEKGGIDDLILMYSGGKM